MLERDRLAEVTPTWTADDRHHARTQLESRRGALTVRLREALRRAYGVLSPDDADLDARAIEQVLTLARIPEPRLLVGQEMKAAFHRLAFHLLDHRFPGHPDFDPNGTGRELRSAELDTVAGAVDLAAQDKVGRYEVPRGDVATLKKIANPLKLGVMHEQAFVLLHEWPDLINRKAAGHRPGHGRRDPELDQRPAAGPACPGAEPRDRLLLDPGEQGVAARRPPGARAGEGGSGHRRPGAAQPGAADRRRVRRGVQAGPGDLPGAAGAGAQRPVGPGDRPDSLGQGRRTALGGRVAAGRTRAARGDAGPGRGFPRMATSRIVTTLLAQLAAADGATRTLRVLAGAELDKDNAIYAAHLAAADELAAVLRGLTWQLLDDFAAGDDDQDAAAILAELRQAARHEELEVSLAGPLREAERAALELVRTRTRKPLRLDRPSRQEPGPRLDHAIGQRPGAEPGPRGPIPRRAPASMRGTCRPW